MEKRSSFRIAEWDYQVPSVINKGKAEFYVDIPSYEGKYQVSNLHNVRSWIDSHGNRRKEPKILKQWLNHKGYPKVSFCYNEKKENKFVHQLMWLAWRGEIPEGYQVNHINEIKTDNRLDNLNLMTPKENNNWGTHNERAAKANTNHPKKSKPVIQKSLDGEIIKIWPSTREVERELGYRNRNISRCCNGGNFDNSRGKWHSCKSAYGYLWQYEEANTN